jgi:succinate dehydrogenase / fumarate reductase flavoprotein subunit
MGGLWVDYNLMSTIEGLFVIGEANFSDHGANRLGASALMQGLGDGYFVLPQTISNYFGQMGAAPERVDVNSNCFIDTENNSNAYIERLLNVGGSRTPDSFHRELGRIMWEHCGMTRTEEGLNTAIRKIPELREEFWNSVNVTGGSQTLNMAIEKAGRVADFLEFGELMCRDALARSESAGGHFRAEHQTSEGEALRNDKDFCHSAVWEYSGDNKVPIRHQEELKFEATELATRSYK